MSERQHMMIARSVHRRLQITAVYVWGATFVALLLSIIAGELGAPGSTAAGVFVACLIFLVASIYVRACRASVSFTPGQGWYICNVFYSRHVDDAQVSGLYL